MAANKNTIVGGIYAIRHRMTGKLYIGSAVNISSRWRGHRRDLRKQKHHSRRLQNSWNKYGENAFVFEVLQFVEDKKLLVVVEQEYIDYFKSFQSEFGYNICRKAGSVLGFKQYPEVVARHAAKLRGRKTGPRPPEVGAKISAVRMGHSVSAETRLKLSLAKTGKPGRRHSEEAKAKVSAARKGKKLSIEHRLKLSIAHKGQSRSQSQETRAKISAGHRARIKAIRERLGFKQQMFGFGDD